MIIAAPLSGSAAALGGVDRAGRGGAGQGGASKAGRQSFRFARVICIHAEGSAAPNACLLTYSSSFPAPPGTFRPTSPFS